MISGSNAMGSSKSGSSILKKVLFVIDGEPGSTGVINNKASQRKCIQKMYTQVQFTLKRPTLTKSASRSSRDK